MEEKSITGATEEEIWLQIGRDLAQNEVVPQYRTFITHNGYTVLLDIDIDLGGGFESGFSTTILSARFANPGGFGFSVHPQHFTDTIGKAMGMQDVLVGHTAFDEALIVKTNDETRIGAVFTNAETRTTLLTLPDFTFEITLPDSDSPQEESILELVIEEGITDTEVLRKIYRAFINVLAELNR